MVLYSNVCSTIKKLMELINKPEASNTTIGGDLEKRLSETHHISQDVAN